MPHCTCIPSPEGIHEDTCPCSPLEEATNEAAPLANEKINHPAHYGGEASPYEAIKVIEALGMGWGFCVGSALKYLSRAGKKDGETAERDLRKALWYLNRVVDKGHRGVVPLHELVDGRESPMNVSAISDAWNVDDTTLRLVIYAIRYGDIAVAAKTLEAHLGS